MTDLSPLIFGAILILPLVGFLLWQMQAQKRRLMRRIARVTHPEATSAMAQMQNSLRKKKQEQKISFFSTVRLQARLQRAGMSIGTDRYFAMCGGILFFVVAIIKLGLQQPLMIAILIGIIVGLGIPHMIVGIKAKRRLKAFIRLFSDAIDLIVRGLRSGLPVAESINVVAAEIGEPVGGIFEQIAERVKLGVTLEDALLESAQDLQSTEFNFFVTSIILQRETGGNLGEILSNLSQVLRQRSMMRLKIKAMSSEARASAYIVGLLPIGVILALMFVSPDYLLPLIEEESGNLAAAAAVGSMGMGGFIMFKMTQFEI
jgi:tight adherence protein B